MKKWLKIGMMGLLMMMYVLLTYTHVITTSNISEVTFQNTDNTFYSISDSSIPFNQPAKTENISTSGSSLPVIFYKNHSNCLSTGLNNKTTERLLINSHIRYIHDSYLIYHRLLSFNIVFPFHCFW